MREKFEDFFNHEEVVVQEAAKFLAKVEAEYKAGTITKSEFNELAKDALEIGKVHDHADDLDRKAAISKAIEALKIIVKFIP